MLTLFSVYLLLHAGNYEKHITLVYFTATLDFFMVVIGLCLWGIHGI